MYSLQVNKNGCRILVETNDMPSGTMGTFFGKGESMMLSLNNSILKSGKQNIKLKIYPLEGEEFISNYAHVDVKLYYNSNKDSGFSNYECLAKLALPEDIVHMKLSYFEINIPFNAKVPYDYSSRLDSAVDLKNIPDINARILKKFEEKRKLILNGNALEYNKDEQEGYIMLGNMFYSSRAELLEDYSVGFDVFDTSVNDRQVLPIINYEIVYYNNNKLVIIRNKENKENILKVLYTYKGQPAFIRSFIILYMTKESNEFKIW